MKLKFHNRAPARIALAGLLAAISCSSFAQAQKPGTLATAQANSHTPSPKAPTPKAPMPAPPAKGPEGFAPSAQPSAQPGASLGAPGASVQADGRLKPKVIYPEGQSGEMPGNQGGPSYRGGSSYAGPGMSPRMMQSGQMGQNSGFGAAQGTMPDPSGASQASGPRNDPFSPAGAVQPTGQQGPAGMGRPSMPQAGKPSAAAVKKAKAPAEEGPSINLQCTTPEIKAQGVFVGKIQNRYVYKYKSQYCFDLEP